MNNRQEYRRRGYQLPSVSALSLRFRFRQKVIEGRLLLDVLRRTPTLVRVFVLIRCNFSIGHVSNSPYRILALSTINAFHLCPSISCLYSPYRCLWLDYKIPLLGTTLALNSVVDSKVNTIFSAAQKCNNEYHVFPRRRTKSFIVIANFQLMFY